MSDMIYLIIIAELVFTCAICIYFVYRLKRRLSLLNKRLNPGASDSGKETAPVDTNVIAFLIGQLKLTRGLFETDIGKELSFSPLITTVRSSYLNAERRALKHPENSKDYWLVIQQETNRLLGLMSTEANRASKENSELKGQLKLLRDRLNKLGESDPSSQPPANFTRSLRKATESAHTAESNHDELDGRIGQQKQHANRLAVLSKDDPADAELAKKVGEYELLIYKLEQESAQLHTQLKSATSKLGELDQALSSEQPTQAQSKTVLSVIRTSQLADDDSDENLLSQLLDDTKQLGNKSRQNLDNLQDTIFSQRKSILSMENTISKLESELEGSSDESGEKRGELDGLKRQLMESEGCIKILESELDNLYNHLKDLEKQQEELTKHYSEKSDKEILDDLAEELQPDDFSTTNSFNTDFLSDFMSNAIESGSLEDLITVLQHSISEFGFQSIIRLHVDKSRVDISTMGKLSADEKSAIELLEYSPEQPIKINTKNISIHYRNAKAILKKQNSEHSLTAYQQNDLEKLFGFASHLAVKVALQKSIKQRLQNYEYFNEMMHAITDNLEAQYSYQRDETQSIINSLIDQSNMLVGEQATPGQQGVLTSMAEEALARTELLEANRTIVRKQFAKMLEKLESTKAG